MAQKQLPEITIGHLPGRKQWSLNLLTEGRIVPMAFFKDDDYPVLLADGVISYHQEPLNKMVKLLAAPDRGERG